MCAAKLPNGDASSGTGLVGEAGIGPGGHAYAQNVEAAQVKSDLDEGKIPFFNYQYTTGYVTHNGQAIWHGQTIAQAVAILLTKFPPPPDTGWGRPSPTAPESPGALVETGSSSQGSTKRRWPRTWA